MIYMKIVRMIKMFYDFYEYEGGKLKKGSYLYDD